MQPELSLPALHSPRPAPVSAFNYDALGSTEAARLREFAGKIHGYQNAVGRQIIAIGDILLAVKSELAHGQFGAWLSAEFGWSERTAQNYMRAAEVFTDKSETVADLPPTTLYQLAAPSTPEPARVAVVARLEKGERVPVDAIREIISDAKAAEKRERDIAKLSPRRQKIIRQDDAARAKAQAEWDRKHQREEEARRQMVAFILRCVGDELPEFEKLLKASGHWGNHVLGDAVQAALMENKAAPAA